MQDQQKLLRDARKRLGCTTAELAEQLGSSLSTVRGWLLPSDNKAYRNMPKSAQLLLDHVLAAHKADK